jgi:DNA polymerase-3 subunit epsilon
MSGWLRWRHGKRAANTPLAPFYSDPPINLRKTVADSELLALDFETSGLNEKQDRLLSMGWVLISHGRIRMATAGHCVIRSEDRSVGQSATVHGLLDADLVHGLSLAEAVEPLLRLIRGRALVVHYAPIENGFLQHACHHLYGVPLPLQIIDTLAIEAQRRAHIHDSQGALRLHACRERYGLPRYKAHNAAVDALACAELLLAQVAHIGGQDNVTLGDLLRRSR